VPADADVEAAAASRRPPSVGAMPQLTFAVLGADGVGKSMFRRCALDLTKPAPSPSSSKKMSLEGDVFHITLLELPLAAVDVSDALTITWPRTVAGVDVPPIDGVLALFDVTDRRSIEDMPCLLRESSSLPVRGSRPSSR
jgi:hypothetical protein